MSVTRRLPATLAARLENNPYRRPNQYVIIGHVRLLDRTVCKRCGETLTIMCADPRVPEVRRELEDTEVRTIVIERFVSRQPTNAYTSIDIAVEEPGHEPFELRGDETRDPIEPHRGHHRSAICKTCKAVLDPSDHLALQNLYDADLERMALEDDMRDRPEAETLALLTRLNSRTVVGLA